MLLMIGAAKAPAQVAEPAATASIVQEAFAAVHDGFSSDDVLLDPDLNQRFIVMCRQALPEVDEAQWNWTLLTLRKSGKLNIRTSQRRTYDHSAYQAAAEIAARLLEDRHATNTDRVMCDPALRAEFDSVAGAMAPGVGVYPLRKAAFGLRKARRLSPELVTRVADWNREIEVHRLADVRQSLELVPMRPGIYLFRDADGYWYIGEAKDLRARIKQHLDQSHASSLVHVLQRQEVDVDGMDIELHIFAEDSPASHVRMRRAYESQLISSRNPRLNIRP